MITLNGETITLRDQYRHKYDDAMAEYISSDFDMWADNARGDAESTIGWYSQIGKRILRGDSQGFVWCEKYGNEHEADMIIRALDHFDYAWSEWEDSEDEDQLSTALDYVAYTYACDRESCDPHDFHMWANHNYPTGPIG